MRTVISVIWIIMFMAFCGGFITGKSAFADSKDEIRCLAMNIYHEARNQGSIGMLAVATVTMNRVESTNFPNTVCGVVKQGYHIGDHPIRDRCQFSWYCDGKSDKPTDKNAFAFAHAMAFKFYYGWLGKVEWVIDAMWYHADYVKPDWSYNKRHLATINNHIFYGVY